MDVPRLDELLSRVGTRLKQLRTERRLTQEQLAEAAGLSYKFIGEIERGSANPTVTTLAALADALSVELADLLADPHTFAKAVSVHDVSVAREALESIEAFIQRASPMSRHPTKYRPRRRR